MNDLNRMVQGQYRETGRLREAVEYETGFGAQAFRVGDLVMTRGGKGIAGSMNWVNGDRAAGQRPPDTSITEPVT